MLTLQRALRPAHKNVVILQDLIIPSSIRPIARFIGVIDLLLYRCDHILLVHRDEKAAGEREAGLLSTVDAVGVVEDAEKGVRGVGTPVADVVLAGEDEIVDVFEVGFHAAETPDDAAIFVGDFVEGVGVAAGEDVVAFVGFVDGVGVASWDVSRRYL